MCSVKAGTLPYTVSAHHVVTWAGCSLVLALAGPGEGEINKNLLVAIFHIGRRGRGGINHIDTAAASPNISTRAGNEGSRSLIFLLGTQFQVQLPWVKIPKCESGRS